MNTGCTRMRKRQLITHLPASSAGSTGISAGPIGVTAAHTGCHAMRAARTRPAPAIDGGFPLLWLPTGQGWLARRLILTLVARKHGLRAANVISDVVLPDGEIAEVGLPGFAGMPGLRCSRDGNSTSVPL